MITDATPKLNEPISCAAMDLLGRACILEVEGHLIDNWQLDAMNGEDDDVVFAFSYTNDEGYIFEFEFTEKALKEASLDRHFLSMIDNTGEMMDIGLYSLTPLKIEE